MSDQFWSSLPSSIIALSGLITAIITLWKVSKVDDKVVTVHQQINSRMDQLLNLTAEKSKAEGVKEESDRVK